MRGYTKVMNTSSTIIPGIPYKIRLVIADSNDSDFDSAIFLAAGSFDANLDLGEDISMCGGDSYTLTTDLDANDYNHSWTYNGSVIPGLNGNSINATETGTYGVLITKEGTSCSITDEVVITELNYTTPQTLETCYTGEESYTFNLTFNDAETLALNNEDYEVHYFATEQDANNTTEMVNIACSVAKDKKLVSADDNVVITAGVPFGNAGSTNLLRIAKIIANKNLT